MGLLERTILRQILGVIFLLQILSVKSQNFEFWNAKNHEKAGEALTEDLTCRYRDDVYYPIDLFRQVSCAWCYMYTPPYRMVNGTYLNIRPHLVIRGHLHYVIPYVGINGSGQPVDPDNPEVLDAIQSTFLAGEAETEKWLSCCDDAELCCDRMLNETKVYKKYCPRTWDGWLCWSDAPPYSNQKVRCPWYIYSSDPPTCHVYAQKECLSSGEWYYDNVSRRRDEHTDYTGCSINNLVIQRTNFHIALHAVSLASSLPACGIFLYFRTLRNQRFIIHRNLIIALILHNLSVVLFKSILVLGELEASDPSTTAIAENTAGCKILVWLDKYSTMAVFAWMLCEGLYLHRTIAAAFQEKQRTITFYIIGWAVPLIPTVSWAIAMSQASDFVCWLTQVGGNDLIWIVDAPRIATLIVNLVLLVDIIRVLYTKLRTVNTDNSTHIRKMVKATIILIPIFGIQFLVTGVKPDIQDCLVEQTYYFFAYLIDGLQGCIVAIVYCYLNMEVRQQVFRLYNRIMQKYNFQSETRQTNVTSENDTGRRMTLTTIAENGVNERADNLVPNHTISQIELSNDRDDRNDRDYAVPSEVIPSASEKVLQAISGIGHTEDPELYDSSFSSDADSFDSTEA